MKVEMEEVLESMGKRHHLKILLKIWFSKKYKRGSLFMLFFLIAKKQRKEDLLCLMRRGFQCLSFCFVHGSLWPILSVLILYCIITYVYLLEILYNSNRKGGFYIICILYITVEKLEWMESFLSLEWWLCSLACSFVAKQEVWPSFPESELGQTCNNKGSKIGKGNSLAGQPWKFTYFDFTSAASSVK